MKSARLFVGGLSDNVDNHLLSSKLSNYGSVSNIEIKEKKDVEGNVTFRFAYVNIEAPEYQIEECVHQLNGTVWSGSRLRVEVAKESFLERLKRERAKTQEQHQQSSNSLQSNDVRKSQKSYGSNYHDYTNNNYEGQALQVEPRAKKKRNSLQESNASEVQFDTPLAWNEDDGPSYKKKQQSMKKNEAEEEMLTSFKAFSSVWADSDEEEDATPCKKDSDVPEKSELEDVNYKSLQVMVDDEDDTSDEDSDASNVSDLEEEKQPEPPLHDKRQNWGFPSVGSQDDALENDPSNKTMTRYDPTRPEHKHFRILPSAESKEVEGGEESQSVSKAVDSSGFSFLTMFEQLQKDEASKPSLRKFSNQNYQAHVERSSSKNHDAQEPVREALARLPVQKARSFFFTVKDERIQEGLDWMVRNNQDRIIPEYEAIESDLYTVIKTRSSRAKKEFSKESKDFDIGKHKLNTQKSNWSSDKNIEISGIEEHYYDYGWRKAVQFEETRKGKGRLQSSTLNQGRRDNYTQNHNESQSRGSDHGSRYDSSQSRGRDFGSRYDNGQSRGSGYGSRYDNGQSRGNGYGSRYDSGQGTGSDYSSRYDRGQSRGDSATGRGGSDGFSRGRGRGGTSRPWSRGRGDFNEGGSHNWENEVAVQ